MTYLPELRESLVEAASRQAESPADAELREPTRRARRGRRPLGALVLMSASVAALVVAGAVLVLVGHRSPGAPVAAPAKPAYGDRAAARAVAVSLLSAFKAPAGAVPVSSDLSRPRQLGFPGLAAAGALDLHRFYRLRGDPQAIMSAITPQRSFSAALSGAPGGGFYGTSSGSSSASAAGSSNGTIETASMTFPLAPVGGIAREIQIGAASAGHGMTALRVDAQAWWLVPRPASEQIPSDVTSITVQELGPLPRAARKLHPLTRLITPAQVHDAVALLNGLGIRQPSDAACRDANELRIRLVFEGTGQDPAPVAVIHPGCGDITLSLGGRAQPPLRWSSTSQFVRGYQFIELLTGAPRTDPLALLRAVGSVSTRASRSAPTVRSGPAPTGTATVTGSVTGSGSGGAPASASGTATVTGTAVTPGSATVTGTAPSH